MRKGPQGDRHIFRPQRVEVAQQPNGPKNEPVPGGPLAADRQVADFVVDAFHATLREMSHA